MGTFFEGSLFSLVTVSMAYAHGFYDFWFYLDFHSIDTSYFAAALFGSKIISFYIFFLDLNGHD